jgi:hypothetical protein
MPWAVQITWEGDDRRLLDDLLGALDVALTEVEETLCVTSARFDALGSAAEVYELAQRLAAAFRLSADANPGIEIKIGTAVYEMAADGKVAKNAFTTASFRGGGRMTLTGFAPTILIQPADRLSEAEKEAARARQAETEYQARLVRISTRVRAAFVNERAAKVQRLLAKQTLDTTIMNLVEELITADLGRTWAPLHLEKQRVRFARSIGHPETFGDQARHATSKQKPHPNPMLPVEAEMFVREAAERWYRHIAARA